MSRIAYLTDTHLGSDERGFQRQPRYLGQFEALFEALRQWLARNSVDLLIHGGDAVDDGTEALIGEAATLFQNLGVPCVLSLGNHDLTRPESLELWRRLAPRLIGNIEETWHVGLDECDVFIVSHHWQPERDFFWSPEVPQQPRIDARQEARLCAAMRATHRPAILVSHAPANAISTEQTGLEQPAHPPDPLYLETLNRIAAACPNLRLVLSGHNHAHSAFDNGSFVTCTTAAFSEHPAELRLIDVNTETITVETVSLAAWAGLSETIAPEYAWTLGKAPQRGFSIPLKVRR